MKFLDPVFNQPGFNGSCHSRVVLLPGLVADSTTTCLDLVIRVLDFSGCVRCAPASVVAKLIEYRAEVDPPCRGVLSPHPLANLGVWACSNPYLGGGFKDFWNFHPENWGRFPF